MTLPSIDSIDTYGGALNDYEIAVVDPSTDRAAADANKAYASIAAATHLVPRAWVRMTLAATTGGLVLNNHDACWGSDAGVAPTLARSTNGVYTITWGASQEDELGVSHTINLRFALCSCEGTTIMTINPTVTAANVLTIRTYDSGNSLGDLPGNVINVVVF